MIALILGIASIALALFVSNYIAMAVGLIGIVFGAFDREDAKSKTGMWLSVIGIILGISAMLMKMAVDRSA